MVSESALYARDPALLRRINTVATLRELHAGPPLTLTELVNRTGLSRRTAEAVLDELLDAGWVEDQPPPAQARGVGRPARRYRFRATAGYVMGVDIDTDRVRVVVSDLAGTEVGASDVPSRAGDSRDERLAAVRQGAKEALARARVAKARLRAVTVGTPGIVLPDGEVTICQVLNDWAGFSLREALGSVFACDVVVENDVNLAATGERWRGACAGIDNTVWVQTGRRTRAAITVAGLLYRGADGAAGEVGWVSELGWSEVRDHPLSSSGSGRSHVGRKLERTLQAARAGDPDALEQFDSYGKSLSRGLAAVVLTLNPSCLVLGGGAALAGDLLVEAVSRHLEPMCLKMPLVRTSELGEDAVVTGAIRTGLDLVEASLFSVLRA